MSNNISTPTTASAGRAVRRLVAGLAATMLAASACSSDDTEGGIAVETSVPASTVASEDTAVDTTTSVPVAPTEGAPTDATTSPPPATTESPPAEPAPAEAATEQGELTTEQAGARALEEAPPGSALDDEVYAETVDGQPAWEVEVEHPDGSDWDYYIHRVTGELLAVDPD